MAPTKVFITGVTGYIGSTAIDLLLHKKDTASKYSFRALVRSPEKAENNIRPLGIVPVLGSLDDLDLLEKEAANADVVLSFADADHLKSTQAILKGLKHRPRPQDGRRRPILIHTSGTGVLLDGAYGSRSSDVIYYDNDVAQLSTLGPDQPHRIVDLEIISPSLINVVDTYIVAPPTIWGFGTGPGNHNSIQIPHMVRASLKHQQALQIGDGLNIWSKVHVIDLAHLYVSLLESALQEPQDDNSSQTDIKHLPLPKNDDAYYFVQEGKDFKYGEVAQEIAKIFKNIGINEHGTVKKTTPEEEAAYWPPGSGLLLGGNSRSRAIKARELLRWEPKYTDFNGYIAEEIHRQVNLQE
ncbi:hypothetical protein BG011_002885 [Mortierella polycephala]|uniref:NAD(P)-binding domain-containing protein n=1 Tax=Mortierella polycephala TaxID=41804 RepID=A0A9P6Q5N7_9FUNG|nr:hypothetical protein BG011_002885 [Mortierella polycephala]